MDVEREQITGKLENYLTLTGTSSSSGDLTMGERNALNPDSLNPEI